MSVHSTKASIESITPLTDTILHVVLNPEHYIAYQAGQYIEVLLDDQSLYFSIANAPLGSKTYELHIRHHRDNPSTQRLLEEIKQQGSLTLRAPFGEVDFKHLNPIKPILFIAAGTGFAPVNAMIEQLLANGESRAFELIWGARTQSDLYLDEKVKQWQNHVHQFQYVSLLSSQNKKSLASVALSRHAHHLYDWQIVLSGPFDLIYDTRDQLVAHGVLLENLFSDAFQFEDK